MATTEQSDLKELVLSDVRFTGKELGRGAYGSVVEVKVSGDTYAAKRIHANFFKIGNSDDIKYITSTFVRECKLTSILRHPHIVKFLGVCYQSRSSTELPALVMECLDTSLHEYLESTVDVPVRMKVSILYDVAQGLLYLHSQEPNPIIHRDLTARNVLLTSKRVAKIADLGVARIVDLKPGQLEATMTRGPGNIIYMPPEAMGPHAKYNTSLDVFSFGNLSLFTLTQVFPDLKAATFTDPDSGMITGLSEIDRREDSFMILRKYFEPHDSLTMLTRDCLQNLSVSRPATFEIVDRLQSYMKKNGISSICEIKKTIPEPIRDEFEVFAMYDFPGLERGDLPVSKGEKFTVVDDSREHWWRARNQHGREGYIPSNYVKRVGLDDEDWYFPTLSRTRTEDILKVEGKEGGFVVRIPNRGGDYRTLSICHKGEVKHYHIKQDGYQKYFISEKHRFPTIKELIEYHKLNPGGMVTRLRKPPAQLAPHLHTTPLFDEAWEIDKSDLTIGRELGSGQLSRVVAGKWKSKIDIAIKMMIEGSVNVDDFIEEATVMKQLQHENLLKLYGVCTKQGPIFIVEELMVNGSLQLYIRQHKKLVEKTEILLDMAIQICSGMKYLQSCGFIHRDLAAHNCLIGDRNVVKVAEFGMARFVIDDEYTTSKGAKFPIKWAAPEIITHGKCSSRSDVWSYGILLWELWTGGKIPYPTFTNSQVMDEVLMGYRLERPKVCPSEIYTVIGKCWLARAEERPVFATLLWWLQQIVVQYND